MKADELEVIDLDALVAPIAKAKIFQKMYDVYPINGRGIELLQKIADREKAKGAATAKGSLALTYVEVAREIIVDAVPKLPLSDRLKLSVEQLAGLIGISTRQYEHVKEALGKMEGNGERPAAPPKRTRATGR